MGLPLARFYFAHALFNTQQLPDAKLQLAAYFADVDAAGPQRILNMPNGMLGRVVTDAERAASRFKTRASSLEAQADAHIMLALIAEREEGPAAAVPHLLTSARTAGNDRQKLEVQQSLARIYEATGEVEKLREAQGTARDLQEKIAADEAAEARKKAEADEKSGQDDVPEAEEKSEGAANNEGDSAVTEGLSGQ